MFTTKEAVSIARLDAMKFRLPTLYSIVFLSGFAGLGYEMVWTRMLSVGLGHEIVSVLAVVAAFFCGMASGSWFLGYVSAGCKTTISTARWYAGVETLMGCWSLILIVGVPAANRLLSQLMGVEPSALQHWTLSFFFPFILLLPATFAMGGTLPMMSRIFQRLRASGSPVAGLYAVNTLGAVAGTLLSTFIVIPSLGFRETLLLFAVLNFACALGVLCSTAGVIDEEESVSRFSQKGRPARGLATALFVTGFLGIGYEVLVVRAMSQSLENTVYSFASTLSVYLLGTAGGAAIYQRTAFRKPFSETLSYLLTLLSGLTLLGTILLRQSGAIYGVLHKISAGGFEGSILAEMGLATVVFLMPTMAMGATFAHLAQQADTGRIGLGGALCINTIGGALAPIVCGIVLLPLLGPKIALSLISVGYLTLIPLSAQWRYKPALASLLACAAFFFSPCSLNLMSLERGDVILEHRDGVMASVSVVKDRQNEVHLKINNRFQMGGTSSIFSDRREGHIPLLLHANPHKALFLGMGTGATLAAAADHPGLQAEGVELIPEVVPLLHHFDRSTGDLNRFSQLKIVVARTTEYFPHFSR